MSDLTPNKELEELPQGCSAWSADQFRSSENENKTSDSCSFKHLLASPLIWRGCDTRVSDNGQASGVLGLDQYLPDAGWPRGAVTELQLAATGIGELSVLLPLLAVVSAADANTSRWVALIAPPAIPYAHAFAMAGVDLHRLLVIHDIDHQQALWAAEQCLRSGHSPVVLLWGGRIHAQQWRRLQLAAEAGNSSGLVFQPPGAPASHVALSMSLQASALGLDLQINRGRGSLRQRRLRIALDQATFTQPGQAYVIED